MRKELVEKIAECGCGNTNWGWLGGALAKQDNYHGVLTDEEKQYLEELEAKRRVKIFGKG